MHPSSYLEALDVRLQWSCAPHCRWTHEHLDPSLTAVCMLCSLPCQGKFEREAAELKENSAQAMKEQGDTLLRQGNFEGAVNAYDRALDLDGSLTPVLGNRAICKLKLKQYRCAHC